MANQTPALPPRPIPLGPHWRRQQLRQYRRFAQRRLLWRRLGLRLPLHAVLCHRHRNVSIIQMAQLDGTCTQMDFCRGLLSWT